MKQRGLAWETIQKYNVGVGVEGFYNESGHFEDIKVLYFPMYKPKHTKSRNKLTPAEAEEKELIRAKIRGIGQENKKYMRQFPIGGNSGFFGFNLISPDDKFVVLTEG